MVRFQLLVCLGAAFFIGCSSDTEVQFGSGASAASSSGSGQGGAGQGGQGGQGGIGQGGAGQGGAGQGGMNTGSSSSSSGAASSSSSGGGTTIPCGAASCDGATQKCCATMAGQSCIDAAAQCQGLSLDCTSAANCIDGQKCCLVFGGPGMPPTASCATACMGGAGGTGTQLCSTDAECPNGQTCKPAMFPGGFMACAF